MGEVAESAADTRDLFDEQVHLLGRAVAVAGAMVVEDLGLPRVEGAAEPAQLGNLGAPAFLQDGVEQGLGVVDIDEGVCPPELFLIL